ncbi:MAG: hypothetical protein AUJ33_01490 [Parcubacteria group bacterium CG1_02_40_25]|nr:MAG: hypothetical protein AUJ33_01490 [Parcubacteria group bacterium CG1_02_40_25]
MSNIINLLKKHSLLSESGIIPPPPILEKKAPYSGVFTNIKSVGIVPRQTPKKVFIDLIAIPLAILPPLKHSVKQEFSTTK